MTAPVLTSNSPSSGSIAWTAFNIQYLGVAYPIPAGNTNKKFTWWPFNAGLGGPLQSSDTFPSTLTSDDLLLFLNRTGIAVNAQMADVLYGDLMVPGSILATSIGAGQITADKLSTLLELDSRIVSGPDAVVDYSTAPPTMTLGTTSTTGGIYFPGTWSWAVSAITPSGTTIPSNIVSATLAANGKQTLNWTAVPGATSYTVYGGTLGQSWNILASGITGTTFTATTSSGTTFTRNFARVEVNADKGLQAFNKYGEESARVDRATGVASFPSGVGTGFPGNSGVFLATVDTGRSSGVVPIVEFVGPSWPANLSPAITAESMSSGVLPGIRLYGGAASATAKAWGIDIGANGLEIGQQLTAGNGNPFLGFGMFIRSDTIGIGTTALPNLVLTAVDVGVTGAFTAHNSARFESTSDFVGAATFETTLTTTGLLDANGGISVAGGYALGGGGSINGAITNNAGITISGANNSLTITGVPTTTSGANVRITSGGVIQQVTSLLESKVDPEPLPGSVLSGVLSLESVWFYDRGEVEENGGSTDGLLRIPGLIAEDVAAKAPHFAIYKDDGSLQGVSYDRIGPALIPVVRDHDERIAALEAKIGQG